MQAVIALLIGWLIDVAGTIAGRVMISLGISLVTMTGITAALNYGASQVSASWAGLPAIALQILGALSVSRDIGIIFGAIAARLALKGLSSDSLSFWVMRGKVG